MSRSGCTKLGHGLLLAAGLALGVGLNVQSAAAGTVTFNLDTEFSGGADPAGPAPWLVAVFTDLALNTIQFSLSASGLTGDEFVGSGGFHFNVDPFIDPITASFVSGQDGTFDFGEDEFHADGDGFFDALLAFGASGDDRLTAGETSVWELEGVGLSTANILALSLGAGNSPNGLYVAAHVQGIDLAPGSGWITGNPPPIPIPAALPLFGLGLAGLAGLNWLRRRPQKTGESLV